MADNQHLLVVLSYVVCLSLFFVPSYYAAQGGTVVPDANDPANDTVHESTTSPVNTAEDIQLSTQPQSSIPSDAPHPAVPSNLNASTSAFIDMQNKWVIYVEQCCHGWKVIVGIAAACLLALPPFLQIAGPKDAVVRGLIYISTIHFGASLASAQILVYYFCKEHFRTGKFALDWYDSAKQHRKSYSQMPWIVLGVPAIFFCWAIAFVILALATSVWRGGISLPDPLPTGKDDHSVTVVRSIVSVLFFADVACVAVLFRKLRALAE